MKEYKPFLFDYVERFDLSPFRLAIIYWLGFPAFGRRSKVRMPRKNVD
jgi:hypothetical protein